MQQLFPGIKNLDYVCCWYKKANDFIQGTTIECAFVSTNSIAQGETVARFYSQLNYKINFAYQSFVWSSEASQKQPSIVSSSGLPCLIEKRNSYIWAMPRPK